MRLGRWPAGASLSTRLFRRMLRTHLLAGLECLLHNLVRGLLVVERRLERQVNVTPQIEQVRLRHVLDLHGLLRLARLVGVLLLLLRLVLFAAGILVRILLAQNFGLDLPILFLVDLILRVKVEDVKLCGGGDGGAGAGREMGKKSEWGAPCVSGCGRGIHLCGWRWR